jgi:exosortase
MGNDLNQKSAADQSATAVGSDRGALPRKLTIAAALLLAIGYLPALIAFGIHLWDRPHYQFFPLALAGAWLLAWRGLKSTPAESRYASRSGLVLLATVSLALLGVAAFYFSPWLGTLSALVLVMALMVGSGGTPLLSSLSPAFIMILILVCLPLESDRVFVFALRRFAVVTSGFLLDGLHVPFVQYGNIIEIKTGKLFVDEACSGINSAFFVVALSLFYGLWNRREGRQVLILTLASLSFVLLGNVVRIAGGAFLNYRWGIDLLTGWKHETAGLVLFAIYVGLILSMDRLLVATLARPVSPATRVSSPTGFQPEPLGILRGALRRIPSGLALAACGVFTVCGLVMAASLVPATHFDLRRMSYNPTPQLKAGYQFSLPEKLAAWQRLDKSQYVAQVQERFYEGKLLHSDIWAFRNGPLTALISFDYPYRAYHDLTLCYTGAGWNVRESKFIDQPGAGSFQEVSMRKKPFLDGYLLEGSFLPDGQWYDGLAAQMRSRFGVQSGPVYQVQVLVATATQLTAEQRQAVRQVFEEARRQIIQQFLAQLEKKP